MTRKIHLIANSHLDPVWIWDRTCGRDSWSNTIYSVVRLMQDDPEVTFSCSAAALYRWIEETDAGLFNAIRELVAAGRWEIVGGWEVQSDALICRPETIVRQALSAKGYFRDKFGVDVDIAYSVDAFGHAAGLPKLLKLCGFTRYVHQRSPGYIPPLFDWEAEDGSRVTALKLPFYGTPGMTKDEFTGAFRSIAESQDRPSIPFFFGLGDHGGGISREQVGWLKELRAEGKYEIVFSTLASYFAEAETFERPLIRGELIAGRGGYSICHEVKRKVARATSRLLTAEKLGADAAETAEPWRELLFNHFHDILPGTSIREAYVRDVFPGLGGVEHSADAIIDRQLARRTAALDTLSLPEGGFYLWNPHPTGMLAIASILGFTDPNNTGANFNALSDSHGNLIPLQLLPSPTAYGPCGLPWARLTAVVPLEPMGETALAYVRAPDFAPAPLGFERQRTLLSKISFPVYADDSRTWGFDLVRFVSLQGAAKFEGAEEYADGPVCSILRARYSYGASSKIRLDIVRYRGIDELELRLELDWHEVRTVLKIAFDPSMERPEFVTGGLAESVTRINRGIYDARGTHEWHGAKMVKKQPMSCEVPVVDWCADFDFGRVFAVYAPDLHSCDHEDGLLRVTLLRPAMHADFDYFERCEEDGWMDLGLTSLKLWVLEATGVDREELPLRSGLRLANAEAREITAHAPSRSPIPVEAAPRIRLDNPRVTLEALRRDSDGTWVAHLQNNGPETSVDLPIVGTFAMAAHSYGIVRLEPRRQS